MVKKCVNEAIKNGKSFEFEARIITPKGKIKWVFAKGEADMDDKKCVGITGIFQDITERKRSEAEKKKAEEQLHHITNSVPGTIFQFKFHQDGNFSFPFVSQNAENLLGFRNEEMKNVEFLFSRIHPDDYESTLQSIFEANRDKALWSKEYRVFNKNDQIIWIKGHSVGSKDKAGNVIHSGVFLDISQQKNIEKELELSKRQYTDIANNLPGIVLRYKLNQDGTDQLLFVSEGVKDLYEVSPQEAIKNANLIWDKIHPDDLTAFQQSVEESAQNLSPWHFMSRIQLTEGRIKWVSLEGTPHQQEDGSIIWDTLGVNITKQKEAEIALELLNEQLEKRVEERAKKAIELSKELEIYWLAAEHAKSGVWRYDVRTKELEWDDIMYDLYGIEKNEFSGAYEAWESSLLAEDVEENVNALQETIKSQKDLDILFRINHKKSGEVRYIRGKAKAEINNQGETIAVYGTNYDVTFEMQLAEEREKIIKDLEIYQMASKNAEVGVWILNPETNDSKWDNTLLNIYELKQGSYKDDIVPFETYIEMVHSEDVEKVKSEIQKTLQTGTSMDFMFRIVTAETKTSKFIRTKGKPYLDDSGKVISIYGTNWDITKEMKLAEEREEALNHLKETQSQLVLSEKMASLGTLTAGIAHEINNPLNFIRGGEEVLRKQLNTTEDIDKEEFREVLDWIKSGTDRAKEIVKSLGHISRNNEAQDEDCDVHKIVEDCILVLLSKNKNRIKIMKDFEAEDPIVLGNSGKLHQVFLNLLSNSMDAISEKGEIKISTKEKKEFVEIRFVDNGCGINEQDLNSIMDPFFTTKPPGKGTGLGLSISKSIINDHKGQMEFKSKLGEGTTCIIKIPKDQPND